MKNIGFFILLLSSPNITAQTLLLEENFDYGINPTDLVTASSSVWSTHSGGTGSLDVQYLTSGLTYSGYTSSGVGGSANISNSRTGDDSRTFTSQTSGSVYLSTLVNVSSATTSSSGEYILHFGNTSTHFARMYIRNSSSNLQIGLSKSTEVTTFSTTNFNFNTTYLIVIKYTFLIGVQDDRVDLWVISSGVPSSEIEAGIPTIENVTATTTDASSLSAVSLRQGTISHSVTLDGIRISDSWSQAPLPVELSLFSAIVLENSVKLNWRTETEVSNYGFEIERINPPLNPLPGGEEKGWVKIGFVEGHGNSNSPKDYSFLDQNVSGGKYSYRLKQIDTDGKFEYSKVVEVDLSSITKFELSQNYPNPFNPVTTINFSVPQPGNVKLTVYNILGEEVTQLVNGFKEAGMHTINFSAKGGSAFGGNASGLPSGGYIYRLEANGIVQSRKMILLK